MSAWSTLSRWCVTATTVVPARARVARSAMIRASVAGSRLDVASSTTSSRGAASISAANVARFASPPESVPIDA